MKDLIKTLCVAYVGAKVIKGSANALIKLGEAKAYMKMGFTIKEIVDDISGKEEESDD